MPRVKESKPKRKKGKQNRASKKAPPKKRKIDAKIPKRKQAAATGAASRKRRKASRRSKEAAETSAKIARVLDALKKGKIDRSGGEGYSIDDITSLLLSILCLRASMTMLLWLII